MIFDLLSMGAFRQYNVALAKQTSVNASILLSYLIYQQQQFGGKEFYNSAEKITKYTGLSRREIDTATAKLVSFGLIKRTIKGLPAVAHFHLDKECELKCDALVREKLQEEELERENKLHKSAKLDEQNEQTCYTNSPTTPIYKNIDNKIVKEEQESTHLQFLQSQTPQSDFPDIPEGEPEKIPRTREERFKAGMLTGKEAKKLSDEKFHEYQTIILGKRMSPNYHTIYLKPDEWQKLVAEFGQQLASKAINILHAYKMENEGTRTYFSDYLTARKWPMDEAKKQLPPKQKQSFGI